LDLVLTDEIADVVVLDLNQGVPTGVAATTPTTLSLLPTVPNPASDGTLIRFGLPTPGDARITVYDATDRRVDLAGRGGLWAGGPRWRFDRRRSGRALAPGVYFYTVTAGGAARSDRMVVLR